MIRTVASRVPAFLLSLLCRQSLLTGDKFGARYPHGWLVWEPGEWVGPGRGEDVSRAETRLPSNKTPDRPLAGDALCFELRATDGATLKLGRSEENDLVVNDMTVSREHLRLTLVRGNWIVTPGVEAKATVIGDASVAPGMSRSLKSGDTLKLGGISMSFYESVPFAARVKSLAETMRR